MKLLTDLTTVEWFRQPDNRGRSRPELDPEKILPEHPGEKQQHIKGTAIHFKVNTSNPREEEIQELPSFPTCQYIFDQTLMNLAATG